MKSQNESFFLRPAEVSDIEQIQEVRQAVTENVLSDPSKVTDEDVREFITQRGKGWVAEVEGRIIGFSIADLQDHNVWALFLRPAFVGMGIGKALHNAMLAWYFSRDQDHIWLSTEPNTRAEKFYELQGWRKMGLLENGEMKFEMHREDWEKLGSEA